MVVVPVFVNAPVVVALPLKVKFPVFIIAPVFNTLPAIWSVPLLMNAFETEIFCKAYTDDVVAIVRLVVEALRKSVAVSRMVRL